MIITQNLVSIKLILVTTICMTFAYPVEENRSPRVESFSEGNFPGFTIYQNLFPPYIPSPNPSKAFKLVDSEKISGQSESTQFKKASQEADVSSVPEKRVVNLPGSSFPGFTVFQNLFSPELSHFKLKALKEADTSSHESEETIVLNNPNKENNSRDSSAEKRIINLAGSSFPGFTLLQNLFPPQVSLFTLQAFREGETSSHESEETNLLNNSKDNDFSDSSASKKTIVNLPGSTFPGFTLSQSLFQPQLSLFTLKAFNKVSDLPNFESDISSPIKSSESNDVHAESSVKKETTYQETALLNNPNQGDNLIDSSPSKTEIVVLPGSTFPGFTISQSHFLPEGSHFPLKADTSSLHANLSDTEINLLKPISSIGSEQDSPISDSTKSLRSREPSLKPDPINVGGLPFLFPYLFPGHTFPGFTLDQNLFPPSIQLPSIPIVKEFISEEQNLPGQIKNPDEELETIGVSQPLTTEDTDSVATHSILLKEGQSPELIKTGSHFHTGNIDKTGNSIVADESKDSNEKVVADEVVNSPAVSSLPELFDSSLANIENQNVENNSDVSNSKVPIIQSTNVMDESTVEAEKTQLELKESKNPEFIMTRPLNKSPPSRVDIPVNSHSFQSHSSSLNSEPHITVPILQAYFPSIDGFETLDRDGQFFLGVKPDPSTNSGSTVTGVIVRKPNPEAITPALIKFLEKTLGKYKSFSDEQPSAGILNKDIPLISGNVIVPEKVSGSESIIVTPTQALTNSNFNTNKDDETSNSAFSENTLPLNQPVAENIIIETIEKVEAPANKTIQKDSFLILENKNELPLPENSISSKNKTDSSIVDDSAVTKPLKPSKSNLKPSRPRPEYGIQTQKKPIQQSSEIIKDETLNHPLPGLFNSAGIPGWLIPSFKWTNFSQFFYPFFRNSNKAINKAVGASSNASRLSPNSAPSLRKGIDDTDCNEENTDIGDIKLTDVVRRTEGSKSICQTIEESSECSSFCVNSGFVNGSCIVGERCVCHLGEENRFGLVFNKLDADIQENLKVSGGDDNSDTCIRCSCSVGCQRRGNYIGYCDSAGDCVCGLPWHDGTLQL